MDRPPGANVFNTVTYAPKLMAYFEKHKILETYHELFSIINHKRPENINAFVAKNIKDYSRKYTINRTNFLIPPIFNGHKFAKLYGRMYNCPTIQYTRQRTPNDVLVVLKKLKKFLKYHHLDEKNLILINFPGNRDEVLQLRGKKFNMTSVVELLPAFQVPFKTRAMVVKEHKPYIENFKQVKDFHKEISRDLHFGFDGDNENHDNCPPFFTAMTIKDVCCHLRQIMKHASKPNMRGDQGLLSKNKHCRAFGTYNPRVVIIGRRGSGRKTQAGLLARRFHLVYIDVEFLVFSYIKSNCPIGDAMRIGAQSHEYTNFLIAAIVYKRIMQPDCLSNGWVIVGYPNTNEDLRIMMELFATPPNKVIFLHCRERVCLRRISKRRILFETGEELNNCNLPENLCECYTVLQHPRDAQVQIDLDYYNQQIRKLHKYAQTLKETIHINGNHSVETVKNMFWARVEQENWLVRGQNPQDMDPDEDSISLKGLKCPIKRSCNANDIEEIFEKCCRE